MIKLAVMKTYRKILRFIIGYQSKKRIFFEKIIERFYHFWKPQ